METDDVEKKVIQRKQEEICMGQKKVCVGVVGAGAISDIYLKNMIHRFENLYVKSICAAHLESAQKKAQEYGIQAVTMEEIFAVKGVFVSVEFSGVFDQWNGTGYPLITAA